MKLILSGSKMLDGSNLGSVLGGSALQSVVYPFPCSEQLKYGVRACLPRIAFLATRLRVRDLSDIPCSPARLPTGALHRSWNQSSRSALATETLSVDIKDGSTRVLPCL